MRIVCPSCSAAYDVPTERVPPGRTVKCARCAASWAPVPYPDPAATPAGLGQPVPSLATADLQPAERSSPAVIDIAPSEPGPLAVEPPSVAQSKTVGRFASLRGVLRDRVLIGAWLLTFVVCAVLGWAAVARRADIMRAWPPSQRAYAAVGLTAPTLNDRPAPPTRIP